MSQVVVLPFAGAVADRVVVLERGQLTATGEISVTPGQAVVPKDRVPYEIWNKLIGEEKP